MTGYPYEMYFALILAALERCTYLCWDLLQETFECNNGYRCCQTLQGV